MKYSSQLILGDLEDQLVDAFGQIPSDFKERQSGSAELMMSHI